MEGTAFWFLGAQTKFDTRYRGKSEGKVSHTNLACRIGRIAHRIHFLVWRPREMDTSLSWPWSVSGKDKYYPPSTWTLPVVSRGDNFSSNIHPAQRWEHNSANKLLSLALIKEDSKRRIVANDIYDELLQTKPAHEFPWDLGDNWILYQSYRIEVNYTVLTKGHLFDEGARVSPFIQHRRPDGTTCLADIRCQRSSHWTLIGVLLSLTVATILNPNRNIRVT